MWKGAGKAYKFLKERCTEKKGLKGETISNYLASVRAAHIHRGVECPDLRAEMVEAVLSGARN